MGLQLLYSPSLFVTKMYLQLSCSIILLSNIQSITVFSMSQVKSTFWYCMQSFIWGNLIAIELNLYMYTQLRQAVTCRSLIPMVKFLYSSYM